MVCPLLSVGEAHPIFRDAWQAPGLVRVRFFSGLTGDLSCPFPKIDSVRHIATIRSIESLGHRADHAENSSSKGGMTLLGILGSGLDWFESSPLFEVIREPSANIFGAAMLDAPPDLG
jgi:hypothetical protein